MADQEPNVRPRGTPIVTLAIPPLAKSEKPDAKQLRAKYPFESLADRLAYERRPTNDRSVQLGSAESRLNEAAQKSLDGQEVAIEQQRRYDLRTRALVELHSNRVEQFISREGFGRARLPTPTPDNLQLPEAPPLQLASVSPEAYAHEGDTSLEIPQGLKDRGEAPARLPSLSMLRSMHAGGRWNFLNVSAWGAVKGRQQAAGFAGHAFRDVPLLVEPRTSKEDRRAAEPDPKHPWHITRLALISLLKHDTPKVYLSNRLPKMTDLADAEVRELDVFEQRALAMLEDGEELAADATLNRIRMLGAVRASKQCLDCHDVHRGDLLGAFSYELRRDPPVKTWARKPAT